MVLGVVGGGVGRFVVMSFETKVVAFFDLFVVLLGQDGTGKTNDHVPVQPSDGIVRPDLRRKLDEREDVRLAALG